MEDLTRMTFKNYLRKDLSKKQEIILKYVKPKPYLIVKKLISIKKIKAKHEELRFFSFSDVSVLRNIGFSKKLEDIHEIFNICFELNKKQIEKVLIFSIFSCLKWIRKELEVIEKAEEQELKSYPDLKINQAGIKKVERHGILSIIDSLANGDILKYEAIKQLPYYLIFNKLVLNKDKNEFQMNYTNLIR